MSTSIRAFDGKRRKVKTAVIVPYNAPAKRPGLPAIVMAYPGEDLSLSANQFAGESPATIPTFFFTERGYAVVLAEISMTPEGRTGDPVVEMTEALIPQMNAAIKEGLIDGKRLAFLGHSYGGYAAALLVTETDLFRASVSLSGIFDLVSRYGRIEGDISPYVSWSETGQGRMGAPPWKHLKRYIKNSPYYQVERIRTPLLLIHGDQDSEVDEAKKMFTALRRLNRTAQLAIYPGEDHVIDTWKLEHATDASSRILQFLERYLAH